jgi:hypothetical protein
MMGRGYRAREWPGNRLFREVVERHRDAYAAAQIYQKRVVARAVLREVKEYGGRFLEEEEKGTDRWIIADKARVLEKICQALREPVYALRPISLERIAAKASKQKQQRLEKKMLKHIRNKDAQDRHNVGKYSFDCDPVIAHDPVPKTFCLSATSVRLLTDERLMETGDVETMSP